MNATNTWQHLRRFRIVSLCALALMSAAGCANLQTVAEEPLRSGYRMYVDADYTAAKDIVRQALGTLNVGVDSVRENREGQIIMVAKSMNLFSWGEVGRVFVQRDDSAPTTVFIRWMKRSRGQITGTSQGDFFEDLQKAVKRETDFRKIRN